jgi:hypothetical protein
MTVDDRDIGKSTAASTCLDLCHELCERLTAAQNYFSACRRLCTEGSARPQPAEILAKGLGQLAEARDLVHQLRPLLTTMASGPASRCHRSENSRFREDGGSGYRVCFLNRFARGAETITACQRSIVIPSATTREDAVEEAKRRFAELEGVSKWHLHAAIIEVEALDGGQGEPIRVE